MNEQDHTEITWIKFWGDSEWKFVMALSWLPTELSVYQNCMFLFLFCVTNRAFDVTDGK